MTDLDLTWLAAAAVGWLAAMTWLTQSLLRWSSPIDAANEALRQARRERRLP